MLSVCKIKRVPDGLEGSPRPIDTPGTTHKVASCTGLDHPQQGLGWVRLGLMCEEAAR